MNINSNKPKYVTGDLLTLITKNTGALFQQRQTKAQVTLEIKFKKSRKLFSFDIPLQIENVGWMLGLISL